MGRSTRRRRISAASREIKELAAKSSGKVADSVERVEAMGLLLGEIRKSISEASASVSDIVASSAEQSVLIAAVPAEVGNLDRGVEENAALASDSASTARALSASAQEPSELISYFKRSEAEARAAA